MNRREPATGGGGRANRPRACWPALVPVRPALVYSAPICTTIEGSRLRALAGLRRWPLRARGGHLRALRRRSALAEPVEARGGPILSGDLRQLTYGRLEGHAQPAAHGLPDEGEPADRRAGGDRAVGRDGPVRPDPRSAARARRSSSCTTARPTPTATSTSAPRSTRSSRTSSSSRGRWPGSTRRTSPGWDCHGLPIELKVDRELGPKKREMSIGDFRRACRAYADALRRRHDATSSSASACSATGTIPT